MKRITLSLTCAFLILSVTPGYTFIDYLFGGSQQGVIDNSALGDLRAWWTGNPAYTFNPWYSPQPGVPNGVQNAPQSTIQQMQPGQGNPQAPPGQYGQYSPYPQGGVTTWQSQRAAPAPQQPYQYYYGGQQQGAAPQYQTQGVPAQGYRQAPVQAYPQGAQAYQGYPQQSQYGGAAYPQQQMQYGGAAYPQQQMPQYGGAAYPQQQPAPAYQGQAAAPRYGNPPPIYNR